jgi:polysaccharide export outer membrane protein
MVNTDKVLDYRKAFVLRIGKKVKEDFYKLFINGDTKEEIVIESNDSIFIPQSLCKNVYIYRCGHRIESY